jgi:hypothetical protein
MYISIKLGTEEDNMMSTILRKEGGRFHHKKDEVLKAALRLYHETRERDRWRK